MNQLRIALIGDETSATEALSLMLQILGHKVIGFISRHEQLLEKTRKLSPDLIILDIRKDNIREGLSGAKHILAGASLPLILLTASADPEFLEEADAIGVAGCIVLPCSKDQLQSVLISAWCRFNQVRSLRREIERLQQALKDRKVIEQAKGLLMTRERITEADAYRRMQTMSRNRNIAMARLAEAIILTEKLSSN